MAWKDVEVKLGGKTINGQKRTTRDEFVFPIDTSIKEGMAFECQNINYNARIVVNSRDEYWSVDADAEAKSKPEGKIDDGTKSKEG